MGTITGLRTLPKHAFEIAFKHEWDDRHSSTFRAEDP